MSTGTHWYAKAIATVATVMIFDYFLFGTNCNDATTLVKGVYPASTVSITRLKPGSDRTSVIKAAIPATTGSITRLKPQNLTIAASPQAIAVSPTVIENCAVAYRQTSKICTKSDRASMFFNNIKLSKTTSQSNSVIHSTKLTSMSAELWDDYAKMEVDLLDRGIYDFTKEQYVLVQSLFKDHEVHQPFFMAKQRILPYLLSGEKQLIEVFGRLVKKCRAKKGLIVLDMGMNEGFFTMLAFAAGCTVFGFEPQIGCIGKIVSSIQKSVLPGVAQIMNVAVGSVHNAKLNVTGTMCSPGNSFQPKYASTKKATKREISVVALDTLFPTEEVEILHIDVEGFEPYVMEGAKKMLLSGRVKNLIYEVGAGYKTTWNKEQKDFIQKVRASFKECKLIMLGNYLCSNSIAPSLVLLPAIHRVVPSAGVHENNLVATKRQVCGCSNSDCGIYFCEDNRRQQHVESDSKFYKLLPGLG